MGNAVENPSMASVFVSHSARDAGGKAFLQAIFGSVSHKGFFYSWEGPHPPHAESLRNRVSESSSLFVLLSPYIESDPTLAWVTFEVGVAVGLQKPVWVLEHLIGPSHPRMASVPIPGVTGYVERPGSLQNLRTEPYFSLVAAAGLGTPKGPDGLPLRRMNCPHNDCRAEYSYYFEGERLFCPACRKAISLG